MILITGGTGFLGSNILFSLAKEKKIISLYRSQSKVKLVKKFFKRKSTKGENFFNNIIWKKCDILNFSELDEVFSQVNYVIHCAGLVSFSSSDKKKLNEINITGTSNIVNLSIKHKIKKMIFVSSIAALTNDNPNKYSINENDKEFNSYYGFTKKVAELEIWRASQEGVPVVIINPGIIIGNNLNNSQIQKIIKNKFNFYTSGVSGFVTVEDVVEATIGLMEANIKNERFILVSENISFTDTEISDTICELENINAYLYSIEALMEKIFDIKVSEKVEAQFKEIAGEIAPDPLNIDRLILNRLFHQAPDSLDK